MKANKLTLNAEKTHYMVFHRARIKQGYNKIIIRNTEISLVRSTKFLGVIIDDKLNWKEHIQYIKNKISKSIGILYKVRPCLCTGTLRNLYFSFIYPYLIYCNEVWGNACSTHIDPIIKLQKRAVRTITFAHYLDHTEPIFMELNILNFKRLVIQRIAILMFKNSLNMVPKPIGLLFTKNCHIHNHKTRQNRSLHHPIGKGEAIYKTSSFHVIQIWNHMSVNIKLGTSVAQFKKKIIRIS